MNVRFYLSYDTEIILKSRLSYIRDIVKLTRLAGFGQTHKDK